MKTEIVEVPIEIKDLMSSSLATPKFKGRLLVAIPKEPRPINISTKRWATSILKSAVYYGKCRLAIPRSFWNKNWGDLSTQTGLLETKWIDIIDAGSRNNYDCWSPSWSIREIIEALTNGEDVLVPSASEKLPGFVPAMLVMIFCGEHHAVKICCPMIGDGYEFTPFQLAYIYGWFDATEASRWGYFQKNEIGECIG